MRNVLLWLLIVLIAVVLLWRVIFKLVLRIVSRFLRKFTMKFTKDDRVSISFALVSSRIEAGLSISFEIPALRWTCIHVGSVRVNVDIVKFKGKSASQAVQAVVAEGSQKKLPKILGWLPRVRIAETVIDVSFSNPPKTPTTADRTGGEPWKSVITISESLVRFELIHSRIVISMDEAKGVCSVQSRQVDWLSLKNLSTSIQISSSKPHVETRMDTLGVKLSIEAYYMIIPTIAPLIEIPLVPGDRKQPTPIKTIPLSLGLVISDHLSLQVTTDPVGSCEIRLNRITCSISSNFEFDMQSEGLSMSRDSTIHGKGEILSLSSVKGYGNGELLDFDIPTAIIRTAPDGLVYWIRSMVMCGTKLSYTKKPYRVPVRNLRTKIFYDYELCGIEPPDWNDIARYVPKIVPIRIRLNFVRDIEFKHMHDAKRYSQERIVISQGAVLDCNLPREEIMFTCRSVEFFGRSRRRCALIKTFRCWAPMFSGMRLKDSSEILALMGKPAEDLRCHYASTSELGPVPVCIGFSDVFVDYAEDLIHYISRLVMAGIEDVRRWTQDIGYDVVPFYKPVSIRLSRLRFAPLEMAPAVLDLKDWELAIGPTKDCLSFAFTGVKAWVPSTVTIPPILHWKDPALITLRVKRLVPLVNPGLASDYALQPGSWRDMTMSLPQIRGAVAPGLHALTRFIDTVYNTFRKTMTSSTPPPEGIRRGPIKNVKVSCLPGCVVYVVKHGDNKAASVALRGGRFYTTDSVSAKSTASSSDILAQVDIGRFELDMDSFRKKVNMSLGSARIDLLPGLGRIDIGATTVVSSGGDEYQVVLSKSRPLSISVTDNAMSIFAAFSAFKDAFAKAWFIDPLPRLNAVMTHIVDTNQTAVALLREESPPADDPSFEYLEPGSLDSAAIPTPATVRSPLVSGKFSFVCAGGFELSWKAPRGLIVKIPANQLKCEAVFHGFALLGDDVFRRLPDVTDQLLVQWLRYPWTVGDAQAGDSSPGREKDSWDLHSIMTMRISEYLCSAGDEGRWEYAGSRGMIDTPMYAQLLISLGGVEVFLADSRMLAGNKVEIRMHAHNLPTGSSQRPTKLKMSYWTSIEEDPDVFCVDFSPLVHVPAILSLVGSPADADPASKSIPGFVSSSSSAAINEKDSPTITPAASSVSVFDRLSNHLDFGFRINITGTTGRAAGWVFGASKICLFKEEDKGNGMIVMEIRNGQVAMETSQSVAEAVQPLHSTVCQSTPAWLKRNYIPTEVFPFVSVDQMLLHVGLGSDSVFCNIQKVRVWWSPSLSRGLRLSLSRTDDLVTMVSRWKTRFTNELFARLGRSRKKKQGFETIMKILDWFIPSDGSIRLVLRCGDVQLNFHNLLHGVEDMYKSNSGSQLPLRSPSNTAVSISSPKSPDIPKHFLPFRESAVPPPEPQRLLSPQTSPLKSTEFVRSPCDCTKSTKNIGRYAQGRYTTDYLSLEYPVRPSWWTLSAHLQGCPLPPLPLMSFFRPPNSRRERAVGAVPFDKWVEDSHNRDRYTPPPSNASVKPKPRGSQLVLVAAETVFEVYLVRIKGPSNLKAQLNASFGTIQGSVAPTALRGLVWIGQSGQNILRQILQIDRIAFIMSADLFPLRSAYARLLVPAVQLSTDDDAFQIVADVFRNCILYRGQIIDPNERSSSSSSGGGTVSPPLTPPKSGAVQTTNSMPQSKRDAVIEGILTALAVADATLGPASEYLSVEYIVNSISVSLNHRQRCFVTIHFQDVVGKQAFGVNHPHRPMQFSFQVRDILIVAADPAAGGDRTVLRSAGENQTALLAIRGNDRYITLNNKEWHVYDSLFMSSSPLVIDVTQDLIDEIYAFIFPPTGSDVAPTALAAGGPASLPTVQEHVEVTGNKLLTGRNKNRAATDREPPSLSPIPEKPPSSSSGPAQLVFFKFVRFGNIDSIITFKSKQFSLNHMALTVKYYLKRRRLATWKEFLDEWGSKVGKQAFSAFVKHGFSRRKGIQDIIVNKFSPPGAEVDKLLFGKFAH